MSWSSKKWIKREDEFLREKWAEGWSASRIVKGLLRLGSERTRNAVIGRAHRLQLPGRPPVIKVYSVKKKKKEEVPAPIVSYQLDQPSFQHRMYAGSYSTCQWIDGKNKCGKPVLRKSYCEEHFGIVYLDGREAEGSKGDGGFRLYDLRSHGSPTKHNT